MKQSASLRMRGVIFVFLAAVLFSTGGVCVKLIPWNGMSINSGRNLISAVLLGVYLLLTKHKLRFNRFICLGALCVCSTKILFCLANKMTTAANTIVLQYTAPIFVLLLGVLFWKKKPGKLDLVTCGLVLSGVVCFFLDSLETGGIIGNILALMSGLTYAGVFLLNDMPDSDPICSVFWADLLGFLIGLPFMVSETNFSAPVLTNIFFLGAFMGALAYIFMCSGLKTTPAVTASLISGIEPILNPILVAIFYGETIGSFALVGAAIVIVTVLVYNVLLAKKQ